jgi:hypothetical protein
MSCRQASGTRPLRFRRAVERAGFWWIVGTNIVFKRARGTTSCDNLLARLHGAHEQALILPPIAFGRANTILLRLLSADSTPRVELWFQQ